MEYITLCLKSTEYDFIRELSNLIQTPENAYGIACVTNLLDATFVFIRQEHTHFGLPVKEVQWELRFWARDKNQNQALLQTKTTVLPPAL